jgi:type II secretory pathway component PulK
VALPLGWAICHYLLQALPVASSREESIAASLAEEEEQTDMLREALKDLDIDALSPRDALDQLYALKSVLEQEE